MGVGGVHSEMRGETNEGTDQSQGENERMKGHRQTHSLSSKITRISIEGIIFIVE